jgi:hypothetical protein
MCGITALIPRNVVDVVMSRLRRVKLIRKKGAHRNPARYVHVFKRTSNRLRRSLAVRLSGWFALPLFHGGVHRDLPCSNSTGQRWLALARRA